MSELDVLGGEVLWRTDRSCEAWAVHLTDPFHFFLVRHINSLWIWICPTGGNASLFFPGVYRPTILAGFKFSSVAEATMMTVLPCSFGAA